MSFNHAPPHDDSKKSNQLFKNRFRLIEMQKVQFLSYNPQLPELDMIT